MKNDSLLPLIVLTSFFTTNLTTLGLWRLRSEVKGRQSQDPFLFHFPLVSWTSFKSPLVCVKFLSVLKSRQTVVCCVVLCLHTHSAMRPALNYFYYSWLCVVYTWTSQVSKLRKKGIMGGRSPLPSVLCYNQQNTGRTDDEWVSFTSQCRLAALSLHTHQI